MLFVTFGTTKRFSYSLAQPHKWQLSVIAAHQFQTSSFILVFIFYFYDNAITIAVLACFVDRIIIM